jgi:hypothetical protein
MEIATTPNPILDPWEAEQRVTEYMSKGAKRKRQRMMVRRRNAAEALGAIELGADKYIVTKGQFSLIDLISATADATGPAHLTIALFTAHGSGIADLHDFLKNGKILSARWLVDFTFQRRKPHFVGQLRALFGDDCIRITKTHAKLVVLRNDRYAVSILSSMNLTHNPRIEFILVREDPELAAFNEAWVDEIFTLKPPPSTALWTAPKREQEAEFLDV